jgi:hypothetical protein
VTSQLPSPGTAIKIAIDHTLCIQGRRSVVTHRGDVGGDVHPNRPWHEQTPESITSVFNTAGPDTEAPAGTAAEHLPLR